MTQRHHHLRPLIRIATLIAMGDYATKEAAARWLSPDPSAFHGLVHFAVVHNARAAFGLSLGAYTWQLNLALTLAAILVVIPVSRDLSVLDREAPRTLGLILGGALGNFLSLVLSPRGVVDFIAIDTGRSALILNVADVATYVGLAMLVRTGFLVVTALRREVQPQPAATTVQAAARPVRRYAEHQMPRYIHREPQGELVSADAPRGDPSLIHAADLASSARIRSDGNALPADAPQATPPSAISE